MTDEYSKNSLLGQLKSSGILKNSDESEHLPFGALSGMNDTEDVAFEEEFVDDDKENISPKKRINDTDSNLLNTGGIDVNNKNLSDEEKIKNIKQMIKKIDDKIYMLEDFDDKIMLKKLKDEKEALLFTLCSMLDDKEKNEAYDDIQEVIPPFLKILFKIFPVIRKTYLMKSALKKLVVLNENAAEMVSKKVPYGEFEGRYSQFSACLKCANAISLKLEKKIR